MKLEGNLNTENQSKLAELREKIRRAEANDNEDQVLLLEAELKALEKGEVFDREEYVASQIAKKKKEESLKFRKHNVLRNMQSLNSQDEYYDIWEYDGIRGLENPRLSYEHTFEFFLDKFNIESFQGLVDNRSKELNKKLKILDLFGGAYFIDDFKNVSQITGVRLSNPDEEFLSIVEGDYNSEQYLRSLVENDKRNLIIGNLYSTKTWREIEKDNTSRGGGGFDLVVCRPEGPFVNAINKDISIKGVSDTGFSREEIFVSLLERALNLLSNDGGMLFTQTPDLETKQGVVKKFWEDYVKRKSLEGYEFIFDTDNNMPNKSFVVIKNK
jgi:hypothetical protein